MRMFMLQWILFVSCFFCVGADVALFNPIGHYTFNISKSNKFQLQWTESNALPKLSEVKNYNFVLCNGSNVEINPVATLAERESTEHNNVSLDIPDVDNGIYYIQVIAKGEEFITIQYTNRFLITTNQENYNKVEDFDTRGPDPLTQYFNQVSSTSDARVQYAPPQSTVGSTITHKRWSAHKNHQKHTESLIFTKPGMANGKKVTPQYDYTITEQLSTDSTTTTFINTVEPVLSRVSTGYDPIIRIKKPTLRNTVTEINL